MHMHFGLIVARKCSSHCITKRAVSSLANNACFTSFFSNNRHFSPPPPRSRRGIAHALPVGSAPVVYKRTDSLDVRSLVKIYAQLSKSRLSLLVVLTAMGGVALSPLPTTVPVLLSTALGTALCCASANTLNQLQEVPFDAQMARTRMRPLVRRAISPLHATGFAIVTGIAGPAVLWTMLNGTTALLGATNIFLYAGVYTWMKRRTVHNTSVGAVVGALPPLMGWTACGGKLFPSAAYPVHLFLPFTPPLETAMIDNPVAPLAFFMLLYSWQFAHFNPLSYIVRGSYAQAGYRMLSVLSPSKNSFVGLRHAVLLIPICSVLIPISGLTTWTFALTSLLPNLLCVQAAWGFWKHGGEKRAREVFRHGLWYLPVMLALMMVHKQGVDWLKWMGLRRDGEEAQRENDVVDSTPASK